MQIDRDMQTIEFAGAKLGFFQVNAQGVLTRHLASSCSLGYQDAVADADKPVLQKLHISQVMCLRWSPMDSPTRLVVPLERLHLATVA